MADEINIIVKNSTSSPIGFQIFSEKPAYSGVAGTVYMNTWGTAPEVNQGTGTATFQITEQFYAMCGSAPAPLSKGLVISTENYEVASLTTTSTPGSDWNIDIPPKQAPIFMPPDAGDSIVSGGFTINTLKETWIPTDYPNRYCGLGRDNPISGQSGVVPVAVFAPDPNQTYPITPKRTFYIAYGSSLSGLQADVSDLGTPVMIDFTGRNETTATVELLPDFAWGPVSFTP